MALLGLLRDIALLAAAVVALFCIYETLNPEYERPPLKRRFKLFLIRLFEVLIVHAGVFLVSAAIEFGECLRDRCKPLISLFRYPRPQGCARRL